MATPPNALYVRIRHLGNSKGSIYLSDVDNFLNRFPEAKVPVYIPFEETVDVPLVDEVLISYNRGSIRNAVRDNRAEAFIFSEKCVTVVEGVGFHIAQPDSEIILVDTSISDVVITLPPVETQPAGKEIIIKKSTADSNQLIIEGHENDRIDRNSLSIVTTENFGSFTLREASDGWWIASEYPIPSVTGDSAPWEEDIFNITSEEIGPTFVLSDVPIEKSEGVKWNGVELSRGENQDYVITNKEIDLTQNIRLLPGDRIKINYQFEP